MSKFYTYRQNNSGGSFYEDENLSQYVIIEAENKDSATKRAGEVGIYLDGVEKGQDCECCGDRWNNYPDVYDYPSIYGKPLREVKTSFKWMQNEVTIHWLDGRIEKFSLEEEKWTHLK